MALAVVILAAGMGTRMKSKLPKVLHEAAGRPIIEHIVRSVLPLEPEHIVVVVGHGAELVRSRLTDYPVSFALQAEQLGTGHALMQAEASLTGFDGAVLVVNGDGPLLRSETLERLVKRQSNHPGMTLATSVFSNPTGIGRIVRDERDQFRGIVEEKDASEVQRLITEVNPGLYLFDSSVFDKTRLLKNDNRAGEYYITDLPLIYLEQGAEVRTELIPDETEVLGINDRKQLAHADNILQSRIRDRWLAAGVTMIAPEFCFIDDTVEFSTDVVLEPGVVLKGQTQVAEGVRIGAFAHLSDCMLEANTIIPPHTVASNRKFSSPEQLK